MEYIIECMINDPDFELSDEYKISDAYYNNRNAALKIMIECDVSHFDDYTNYLFEGNRYKISLPTNKDELLDLFQFKDIHRLGNLLLKGLLASLQLEIYIV
jgi:hypothetical protein